MGIQASRGRGGGPEATLGSSNGADHPPPWPLEMDLAGGNGCADSLRTSLPSQSQIDASVKYFTTCNEYDFRNDPKEFINDQARRFTDSSSSFRKERVRAFPFTPEVIVGGVVALVRSDLDEFLTSGQLSDPESYKRPAATVIGRAKHIISLVSRAEAIDPQGWNIEKGMMLQFEFAARTLKPNNYLGQFERVMAHTNRLGDYVPAPWEQVGLVDIVGEQLGNLCAAGKKRI